MAQTARDVLIVGLRNAHSMEVQARELMERQSESLTDYPEAMAKAKEHLAETEEQIRRLDQCLEACGESSSTLKDAAQSLMGNVVAVSHAMAGDEILKNTFANNAFENYEIAAYRSLIALCDLANLSGIRGPLQASLAEEERMANWIINNVEKVTGDYIAHEAEATIAS